MISTAIIINIINKNGPRTAKATTITIITQAKGNRVENTTIHEGRIIITAHCIQLIKYWLYIKREQGIKIMKYTKTRNIEIENMKDNI